MAPSSSRRTTIRQSLAVLGIESSLKFENHATRHDEFNAVIKKHYFRAVLQHHPDKGGDDIELFRTIQTSFELLRDLHHGTNRQHQQRATRSRPSDDWLFADCFQDTKSSPGKNKAQSDTDKQSPAPAPTTAASTSQGDDDDEFFNMDSYDHHFASMETPSWEYYQEAAEEDVPLYRVELARSDRSKCTQKGKSANCRPRLVVVENDNQSLRSSRVPTRTTDALAIGTDWKIIDKGEIRIGWMNGQSGTYGGWVHLRCWRVPFKVWLGVPDPDEYNDPHVFERALSSMNDVLLSGFPELHQIDKDKIVRHVMNKDNWARRTAPRKTAGGAASTSEPLLSSLMNDPQQPQQSLPLPTETSSAAIVLAPRQRFIVPVPGKHGASPANVFRDKTFVLTGIFPEIGGGKGLSLGKDKTKAMIVAFGGRVTSSISGKTDVLVVGKEPGMAKVSKARAADHVFMVSLKDLKDGLESGCPRLEDFPVWNRDEPMLIQNFSAGYNGSGLALKASKKDLAVAQGIVALAKKRGPPTSRQRLKNQPTVDKVESGGTTSQATTHTDVPRTLRKRKSTSSLTPATTGRAGGKAKKMLLDNPSSSAVVVMPKSSKRGKKQQQQFHVACDGCGTDCTTRSWFYPITEQDYCDKCHTKQESNNAGDAVLQVKGITASV